jgi:hypothetical protein
VFEVEQFTIAGHGIVGEQEFEAATDGMADPVTHDHNQGSPPQEQWSVTLVQNKV